ncbi:MAG: ABC transporter permease [Rhizobium sp.]|nr:ABC transporter permease [Rhizobium sp.]
MNLAYRDVRHNLFRFVLTCLGLSLLMAVVLAMMGIYNGAVIDALTIARAPKVDVWVVEAETKGPFAESSRIPGSTREAVARLQGVADAGSVTYQNADGEYNGTSRRLYIIGYEPSRLGGPQDLIAGRPITRTHFEMIADTRTGLSLGDRVRLGRNHFEVVGLVRNHVNSGGDPAVYISLLDAQTLQFEIDPAAVRVKRAKGEVSESQDSVNAVIARLHPDADPEQVTASVRRWKHLSGMTQVQEETLLTRSVIERQRRQLGLFMAILMAVSAVVIALIIYMMTIEKLKQIATLKLIGAPDRTIVWLIMQQSLALGVTGWFFGLGILSLVKDFFPRRVVLDVPHALVMGGIIALVCVVASGLGIRAALKADPATALGG